jgi:hypothetical protein
VLEGEFAVYELKRNDMAWREKAQFWGDFFQGVIFVRLA